MNCHRHSLRRLFIVNSKLAVWNGGANISTHNPTHTQPVTLKHTHTHSIDSLNIYAHLKLISLPVATVAKLPTTRYWFCQRPLSWWPSNCNKSTQLNCGSSRRSARMRWSVTQVSIYKQLRLPYPLCPLPLLWFKLLLCLQSLLLCSWASSTGGCR